MSAGPHHTQIGDEGKLGLYRLGPVLGTWIYMTGINSHRTQWCLQLDERNGQKSNVNPLRLSGRKKGGWDILRDVKKGLQRVMNRI